MSVTALDGKNSIGAPQPRALRRIRRGLLALVASPMSGLGGSASAPRLCLIQDNPALLASMKTALREMGYRTTTAASCSEAVRILHRSESSFDLHIIDLSGSTSDRAEVVQAARARTADARFLFLTSSPDAMRRELGPHTHFLILSKPFRLQELRRACEELLAR